MYEIVFGRTIGDVKIGMKREAVRALFTDVEEWREVPYGADQEITYNLCGDFLIAYDQEDRVDFISCDAPDKLVLNGMIIDQTEYVDLLEKVRELDPELEEEDEVGFTSVKLGFGISLNDDREVDSVQVVVEDYYGWKNCE